MPPGADKEALREKAKAARKLQSLAQLSAVFTTYKAACRRHGVPMYRPLAQQMEQNIQDKGGKIDKVTLLGPDIGPGSLKAALEMMAGYASIKNLGLYGCSIGDEGLLAVAQLIRASCYRWYTGSKIRLLEISSDGVGIPLDRWPERYLRHLNGGLAVTGKGHAMPSLSLENDAQSVTSDTLGLAQTKHRPPDGANITRELSFLSNISGPVTTLTFELSWEAKEMEARAAAAELVSGMLPSSMIEGTLQLKGTDKLASLAAPANTNTSYSTPAQIQPIAEEDEPPDGAEDASNSDQQSRQGSRPTSAVGHPSSSRPTSAVGQHSQSPASVQKLFSGRESPGSSLNPESSRLFKSSPTMNTQPRPSAPGADTFPRTTGRLTHRAQHIPPLPLSAHPLDPVRPMSFSPGALKAFSLSLTAQGNLLQILVLDHNQLGDLGALILSKGISRCGALKQMSLEDCGIGPEGALALGKALMIDDDPKVAEGQPKLLSLNLSRNPLRSQGVINLSQGLARCTTLKVLNLAAVDLTEEHIQGLEFLCGAFVSNPSIDQIDLDSNFFGDAGAQVFIPWLREAPHMRKFRITARGMTRDGGGQVGLIMKAHHPSKKRGKKKVA